MALIFVYDSLLRPDNMSRIVHKDLEYAPAFTNLFLYKFGNGYVTYKVSDKKTIKNRVTFGTLYKITDDDMENLLIYYGNEYYKVEKVKATPIFFDSIPSFLRQKWNIGTAVEVYVFTANIENDRIKRLYSDRHMRCGNFIREFLQVYQYGHTNQNKP